MMLRDKSKHIASWKYLGLLPVAALLLTAFTYKDGMVQSTAQAVPLWPGDLLADTRIAVSTDSERDTLPENTVKLDKVVVVGYGEKAPNPEEASPLSLLNTLTGKDGEAVDPLFVIDGEITAKGARPDISPENIASITVWKGDKAIEKYGQKGANGVIEIILKPAEDKKEPIFKLVEEMPRFPGCEDQGLEGKELKQCSDRQMLEFIYTQIKYPKEARDAGIEGVVVVQFVIDKTGEVRDHKIVRSIGGGCDEEVLRIAKQMPTWIPGKQGGKVVAVQFILPVKFKLEAKAESAPTPTPIPQAEMPTLELQDLNLAPNPTTGMIDLRFKTQEGRIDILAVDSAGKQVFSKTIQNFDGNFNDRIDLSQAAKGVIFLTITQDGKSLTQKVILQ